MNPDVWSENARLNTAEDAKAILARAVAHMPLNVDLWMHATQLEEAMRMYSVREPNCSMAILTICTAETRKHEGSAWPTAETITER